MTNSSKILLETLLQIEVSFQKSNLFLQKNSLPILVQMDFSNVYDLFYTIIAAFSIPTQNYEKLYNLLENLSSDSVCISHIITEIEKLIP